MNNLEKIQTALDGTIKGIEGQKEALSKLSDDVHKSMVTNGFAADSCRTVCETTVTIGPDGKPVYSVSCRLVCDL